MRVRPGRKRVEAGWKWGWLLGYGGTFAGFAARGRDGFTGSTPHAWNEPGLYGGAAGQIINSDTRFPTRNR